MNSYRGVNLCSGDCPNGCFHKLIDRAISENTIGGVEPKVSGYQNGRVAYEIRRYSQKLKRHTQTVNGHYVSTPWTHCPICGAELTNVPNWRRNN